MNIYKKSRAVCKTSYSRNKRKNNKINTSYQQPNIENVNYNNDVNVSTYENHRHVAIGPAT